MTPIAHGSGGYASGSRAPNVVQSAQNYRSIRDALLAQMPELMDDPHCLLDTLEGLTDLNEQLAALVRSAINCEALAEGIDVYMSKLQERKTCLKDRAAKMRRIALHCMADLDIKNVVAPDLTMSRRRGVPAVVITDEDAIPEQFVRVKREPDKVAIKKALIEGQHVTGATLSNGSETLQVKI